MTPTTSTKTRALVGPCLLALVLFAQPADAQVVFRSATTVHRQQRPAEQGAGALNRINHTARGHSSGNAYLMAMVSHYMYPHAYQPNPGSNWEEFRVKAHKKFKDWGMKRVDLVTQGNVQYVVMSDDKVIILAFRGSDALVGHVDSIDDWVKTNAVAIQKKVTTWGTVAFTERGFFGRRKKVRKTPGVHTGITNAYWRVRNTVNRLIASHGGNTKRLFITGHSLGAGLATIAAIDQGFARDRPRSRRFVAQGVYTYGGPRVGNGIFRRLYKSKRSRGNTTALNTHRYVNHNDLIAMVPGDTRAHDTAYVPLWLYGLGEPHDNVKYTHVGRTCNIRANGTIKCGAREYRGIGSPGTHHSSQYAHNIFYAYVAGKSWEAQMPRPPTI